jgi:SAM-dependent methyltransferase
MTSGVPDPDEQRAAMLDRWVQAAPGWGRRADEVQANGMPVSTWMIDHVALQPGHRVLELAAGPGDTGFLAAELIQPGGTLICSDGTDAMLSIARQRAERLGVVGVEFRRLQLEWIDLPAADVDVVLCRWGVMLSLDPGAALRECRRVLRPGGRLAIAVWDESKANPWATIPSRALVSLGHANPPAPDAPGMFALAAPGLLEEMLGDAGFLDVTVDGVELGRERASIDGFIGQTVDLSKAFADVFLSLSEAQRAEVVDLIRTLAEPFTSADGSVRFPGRSLVALASA